MDQVDEFNPPPNPAKVTDSRFDAYVLEHGDESWELDALEPAVLADLIRTEILAVRDDEKWRRMQQLEAQQANELHDLANNYES